MYWDLLLMHDQVLLIIIMIIMIMILRIHRNESKKHVAIKLPKRNYVETLNIPISLILTAYTLIYIGILDTYLMIWL